MISYQALAKLVEVSPDTLKAIWRLDTWLKLIRHYSLKGATGFKCRNTSRAPRIEPGTAGLEVQKLPRCNTYPIVNIEHDKGNISLPKVFFTISSQAVLLYMQQMALLGFFQTPFAGASACFDPTSEELHRARGPFEGCSTD